MERMINLIKYNRIDPSKIVTHRFYGYDKIEEALKAANDRPIDMIRGVILLD